MGSEIPWVLRPIGLPGRSGQKRYINSLTVEREELLKDVTVSTFRDRLRDWIRSEDASEWRLERAALHRE